VIPSKFNAHYSVSEPDPIVSKFVDAIDEARIKATVETLANDFFTRNSVSSDAVEAAIYLEKLYEEYGCEQIRTHNFRSGYSPNVICQLTGSDPDAPVVVVGAHYDSRSTGVTNPSQRAPGADDNASGSAALLDILRTAVQLRQSDQFEFTRTIIFALFSGEEQGLYGSAAIASEYYRDGLEIAAMVNLDMIGFPQPNAPDTLYWDSEGVNRALTDMAMELTTLYLGPDTSVALSTGCCSDNQSFHNLGYAAAGVFESRSPFNNPNYHRSTDTANTVTFRHVWRNAQMAAALVGTIAEPGSSK